MSLYLGRSIYLIIISFFILIGILLGYRQFNPQEIQSDVKLRLYTLEELEKEATVIVKGSLDEKLNTEIEFDELNIPYNYRTYSIFNVQKVFRSKNNIQDNQKIKIVEFYAEWRNFTGSYRIVTGNYYKPIEKGKDYILFLYKQDDRDYYEIMGLHQGKYVINKNVLSENGELLKEQITPKNIDVYRIDSYYIEKLAQVLTKYK